MVASETDSNEPPKCDVPTSRADSESEFTLSGCLTVDNALAARRLMTRGFWPRLTLGVLIVVVFSIVLIAVAVSSRPYSPGASNVMMLVACVIFPALLVLPYAVGRIRLHHSARKSYGMFAPTYSMFSPSAIVLTSENAKSELEWALFSRCMASDTVAVLFFKNSKQYLLLARRKLQDPTRWGALVSMIQDELAQQNNPQR